MLNPVSFFVKLLSAIDFDVIVWGLGQDTISRIERRSDLLLSTLRRYVQAMGGELDLVARFPNRPPVLLDHIAQEPAAKGRVASAKPRLFTR